MITHGDDFVSNLKSVFDKSWFERHSVTRKRPQRLFTLANDPDVGTIPPVVSNFEAAVTQSIDECICC